MPYMIYGMGGTFGLPVRVTISTCTCCWLKKLFAPRKFFLMLSLLILTSLNSIDILIRHNKKQVNTI